MTKFNDTEVRWGVLGVGDVCEVKSAPAMDKIDNSSLVAVMRRTGEKAKDYAERHGVPKWYNDAEELLNDPDVNAIYIATPPIAHAELTRRAAAAGKPVYVEKPMGRTYEECKSMIEACDEAGVPLFVAYYRRALPNFLKIKELVDRGAIGEVRLVTIDLYETVETELVAQLQHNWRVKPDIAGGGYFYDLASHQLDFLDFLLGPVERADGIASNQAGLYEAADVVTGHFEFENGVVGSGNWCFTTSEVSSIDRTVIVGSKGQISYPTFGDGHVLLETDDGPSKRFDFEMPGHIEQPLIQMVVDELLGRGSCPSTGITGARTNWVMEQLSA